MFPPWPTLVLIPGLLSDDTVWRPMLAAMGNPPAVIADVSAGNDLQAIAAAILAENPGRLQVAGHSMGARIALEMIAMAPERIERLALLDTGVHPVRDGERAKRQVLVDLAHREGMTALVDAWLPPMVHPDRHADTELMGALRAMVLRADAYQYERQIAALLSRRDATPILSTIDCPVLLLVGRQDSWSPLTQHEEMLAQLSDARLVVIEEAGHFAPAERPEAVAEAISRWLRAGREERAMNDEGAMPPAIPETPLLDRGHSARGYRLNKMAMALGRPENRQAFKDNEGAFLDAYGLTPAEKQAVMTRDWAEMVRLGGNLFFILKISAVDPVPITQIGAAQAGMDHTAFLTERLGKKLNG